MDINEIFLPIVRRISTRVDSLKEIKRFSRSGIEGWLKVEVVAALKDKVITVNNYGPDLVIDRDLEIELKAATDFNLAYIREGALKYGCHCLFLCDGTDPKKIMKIKELVDINLICYETFSDGQTQWVIGIIEPSDKSRIKR